MKLRHLQIDNFRGLKSLGLEFGDTTVLIGENNTGKTTVLDALKYALREVRSRKGCAFDAYDFHLPNASAEPSAAPPIRLRLTFKEDQPGEWGDERTGRLSRAKILQVDANGFSVVILEVTGQFDPVANDFTQDWNFLNLEGQPLSNLTDSVLGQFQNEVSYNYLPSLRDATRQFDAKGVFWRPFLKESKLTPEKQKEIEGMLAEVNHIIVDSHDSFSKVTTHLQDVNRVVPLAGATDGVSIDAVPGRLFEILAKAQVNLGTSTGAKMPVSRHGEGMQSLAVLMLFKAFLQTWQQVTPIVALEEPEAHLHPSAKRTLWHLIEEIPGQKIISTHSGDILAEVPPEAVTRLHSKAGKITASRLIDAALNSDEQRKFNFHIRQSRGELLFARCWLLGEGPTEATLIPAVARHLKLDLEQTGVRCVTYQTGISMETCLKVANAMGIAWVVLADNDEQGADDRQKVRNNLNGRNESDVLFMMPESNIEEHLCINGFGSVYEAFLTEDTRSRVIAVSGDKEYWPQVMKAIKNLRNFSKPAAIQGVVQQIITGTPIPELLTQVIKAAIQESQSL